MPSWYSARRSSSTYYPVICGGAALTRKYVDDDLRAEYQEGIFYANDAFEGLHVMEDLCSQNGVKEKRLLEGRTRREFVTPPSVYGVGSDSTDKSAVVEH